MMQYMSVSMRRAFGALSTLAIIVGAAAVAAAQPIVWNPTCVNTKLVNTTGCKATVTFWTTPPGVVAPVTVSAGGSRPVAFPAGTTVNGVFSQLSTPVAIVSPGPIMPPPAPALKAAGWVRGVVFGPSGCCFDVYFDNSGGGNCNIWLLPGTPPCTP